MNETPIVIVGATASGKSAVAMELARTHAGSKSGVAILCMDAMQVYRGADIGTSKPTSAERAEVTHGGLDLVDFGQTFDVAQYLRHAGEFLREQREEERRVVIVGGTGLYLRALTRGLCEAPQGPEELRAELNALSTEALRERLRRVDSAMLERLDAENPRRLVRAIEVVESTGKSLLAWQEETPEPLVKDFSAYWICREREELHRRIEERVEGMFAAGLVEEVRGLVARYGVEVVRDFAGIGYGEIAEEVSHGGLKRAEEGRQGEGNEVAGTSAFPSATWERGKRPSLGTETAARLKGDISVATRQYAKRQLTWFTREPNLQKVMLTGVQPLSTVLPFLP